MSNAFTQHVSRNQMSHITSFATVRPKNKRIKTTFTENRRQLNYISIESFLLTKSNQIIDEKNKKKDQNGCWIVSNKKILEYFNGNTCLFLIKDLHYLSLLNYHHSCTCVYIYGRKRWNTVNNGTNNQSGVLIFHCLSKVGISSELWSSSSYTHTHTHIYIYNQCFLLFKKKKKSFQTRGRTPTYI